MFIKKFQKRAMGYVSLNILLIILLILSNSLTVKASETNIRCTSHQSNTRIL